MKRLWRASIRDVGAGVVTEHAATLVRQASGKVTLGYVVAGTSDVVNPVYNIAPDETFIGTFHTHPFEDGLTGMPFSSEDIATVINDAEWISLVQSGDDVFALIRTDKTIASVTLSEVERQVDTLYVALQTQHRLSAPDALWIANLRACSLYG
jgi:hypothetical protein